MAAISKSRINPVMRDSSVSKETMEAVLKRVTALFNSSVSLKLN
jgi:hypothetical protein